MKVKVESEKVSLKLNIQKTKTKASVPIISWQIDGKTVETVRDFILGGSKITADGDCNHEIKRGLLLERKVMTNLDSILKSRDITLPTKICPVSSFQSLSHVRLFGNPWTAACQASLSIANSQSLFKLNPFESVMPLNHLILCRLLLWRAAVHGVAGVHKVCLSPLSVYGAMGFDSKCDFAPPTLLLLLCSWTWGISSEPLQWLHTAAAQPPL